MEKKGKWTLLFTVCTFKTPLCFTVLIYNECFIIVMSFGIAMTNDIIKSFLFLYINKKCREYCN